MMYTLVSIYSIWYNYHLNIMKLVISKIKTTFPKHPVDYCQQEDPLWGHVAGDFTFYYWQSRLENAV